MSLVGDVLTAGLLLRAAVLAGSLFVVWKATRAYSQHGSRSMLLLGVGLFLVLVAAELVGVARGLYIEQFGRIGGPPVLTYAVLGVVEQLVRFAGIVSLVGSLYVRE